MLPPNPEFSKSTEGLMEMPWFEIKKGAWAEVQTIAKANNLRLSDKPKALRGGKIFGIAGFENESLDTNTLPGFFSSEREIAIIPAQSKDAIEKVDRLIFITSKEFDSNKDFMANLVGYRAVQDYLAYRSGKPNEHPIPKLQNVMKMADARWVFVTEYDKGFEDFGLGTPKNGIHEMDTEKIGDGDREKIFDAFEKISVDSDELFYKEGNNQEKWRPKKEFQNWLNEQEWYKNLSGEFPPGWISWENQKRVFRGQEWWDDRKQELVNLIYNNPDVTDLFKEFEKDGFSFKDSITSFIDNNKVLFPHIDGRIDNKWKVGKTYLTHGTAYAAQIGKKITADGVEIEVFGGDRAHFGSMAENFAWQISALTGPSEEESVKQQEFIDEYDKRFGRKTGKADGTKKMRELAIFTLYRTVSDVHKFLEIGKAKNQEEIYIQKAKRAIKLSHDILNGNGKDWNGAWDRVHTPYDEPGIEFSDPVAVRAYYEERGTDFGDWTPVQLDEFFADMAHNASTVEFRALRVGTPCTKASYVSPNETVGLVPTEVKERRDDRILVGTGDESSRGEYLFVENGVDKKGPRYGWLTFTKKVKEK